MSERVDAVASGCRRGPYRFEAALHALYGLAPGGGIDELFKELQVWDRLRLHRLDPLYTLRGGGHMVSARSPAAATTPGCRCSWSAGSTRADPTGTTWTRPGSSRGASRPCPGSPTSGRRPAERPTPPDADTVSV